jgi:chromosome segregation ATPase
VLRLSEENDYVKRHEFERSNGKIYERINQTDKQIIALNGKIDTQNAIQEKNYQSQERSEKHLEKISGEITSFKDGFNEVKNQVDKHSDELDKINATVSDKQKWNVGIATAIISGIFALLGTAMQLAPLIFK